MSDNMTMGAKRPNRYFRLMKIRDIRSTAAMIFLTAGALLPIGCVSGDHHASSPADPRLSRAYALLESGQLAKAEEVLREIPQSDPDNRRARQELAYLRIRGKRWKEAVETLGTLVEENPRDMRLRMELGYARHALGDRAAAADEFALAAREPGEFQARAREALDEIAAESAPAAQLARADALLNDGYDDLRRGDEAAAREKFRQALSANPGKTEIAKQLGYMSLADGNLAAAAEEFAGVQRLSPLDYDTALELGYLYDSLHNESAAEKSFAAAAGSRDARIRAAAESALKNIRGRTDPLYVDVDASSLYTSRFADKIVFADTRIGYKPYPKGPLSAYLAVRFAQDSRSRNDAVPQIYSDNVASFGPGVRIQPPGYSASLSADGGVDVNLLRSQEHPRKTEYNFRVVLADYRYWEGPRRTFADLGLNAGFFSRYRDNVIGYLQIRLGAKVLSTPSSQIRVYAPVNAIKDANRDFYNNVLEFGIGVELQPWTRWNLKFRGEALRGTHLGISGRDPNPYGRNFNDFRLALFYSGHFAGHGDPQRYQSKRRRGFSW